MATAFNYSNRKYIIGGIAIGIIIVFLIRLFTLQIMSDDYKKNADSNAFQKKIQYPSRGLIRDRYGRLLVYNEPSYNIMVVMNEQRGIDTADFCHALGITRDFYIARMKEIKDTKKNPGYSRYTPQVFLSQIPSEECSVFQEKLFRFKGFSVDKRYVRHYTYIIRKTKCSGVSEQNVPFLKTKRTSVNLFIIPINPIKKHQKNRLLWCFFIVLLFGYLAKNH